MIQEQIDQNDRLRRRARSTRLRTLKAVYGLLCEGRSRQAIREQIVRWIREETSESGGEDAEYPGREEEGGMSKSRA